MNQVIDYHAILPELILAGTILLVLVVDVFLPAKRKSWSMIVGLIGTIAALIATFTLIGDGRTTFGGAYVVDNYALVMKALADDLHQLRIVLRQQGRHLHERDRGAQPAESLRQLDADRAAADNEEMAWPLDQIEDRLVREAGHAVETGQRRHQRRRAGGDHEAAGPDAEITGGDFARAGEARLGAEDAHTEAGEALFRVMRRDGGDDAVDVVVHASEVDQRFVGLDAEATGMPLRLGGLGGGQQRLRRHAAVVQAVAAHLAGLDQHGFGAQLGRPGGDAEARGAGTDHADVRGQSRDHRRVSSHRQEGQGTTDEHR